MRRIFALPQALPLSGKAACAQPPFIHRCFGGVWTVVHIPDNGRFYGSRGAYRVEAALAKNLPTSLTRNEFTDGRVLRVKDRFVLYGIRNGCKRVLQFRQEPVDGLRSGKRPGQPETCELSLVCGTSASTPLFPFRREPSVRETSQDSGLG